MWNKFLSTNTSGMKVLRTIFQGIVGVIIANLDAIIGVGYRLNYKKNN